MAKKKALSMTYMTRGERELEDMKYKDLQRAVIARGMPFQEVVDGDVPRLSSWFLKHHDNSQDLKLLNEFDEWKELELRKKYEYEEGTAIFHPDLRLGFVASKDADGNVDKKKKPRLKGLDKEKKKKRERLEGTNIFAGTKKALTYQCQKEGMSLKDTSEKVMKQFPEAQEKSIAIWYKRSQKEGNGAGQKTIKTKGSK